MKIVILMGKFTWSEMLSIICLTCQKDWISLTSRLQVEDTLSYFSIKIKFSKFETLFLFELYGMPIWLNLESLIAKFSYKDILFFDCNVTECYISQIGFTSKHNQYILHLYSISEGVNTIHQTFKKNYL